jgi:hypothetical protein
MFTLAALNCFTSSRARSDGKPGRSAAISRSTSSRLRAGSAPALNSTSITARLSSMSVLMLLRSSRASSSVSMGSTTSRSMSAGVAPGRTAMTA